MADFTFFLIYKLPRCFLPSFESIGFSVQEKKQNVEFQDGRRISDRNHLNYFLSKSHPDDNYQVSSQLTFRFRREAKNRFSRWPPWRPS